MCLIYVVDNMVNHMVDYAVVAQQIGGFFHKVDSNPVLVVGPPWRHFFRPKLSIKEQAEIACFDLHSVYLC